MAGSRSSKCRSQAPGARDPVAHVVDVIDDQLARVVVFIDNVTAARGED